MSCFESSTFLKNPMVMNQKILIQACEKLGWEYNVKNNQLRIMKTHHQANLRGEPAIVVDQNNTVRYNSYYMKNGKELMKELEDQFYKMNIIYARDTILNEFKASGFSLKKDYDFEPTEKEIERFSMVAYSKLEKEDEKKTEIRFTIMYDGTIVSDSNYIPEDIHKLADEAMERMDKSFGTERREGFEIKRKEIPSKYIHKSYCTLNNKIKAKN